MVYSKYGENVIPLSKLIGLLFLFCLPLLSILFLKTIRNDLARLVMGTIFLVILVGRIGGGEELKWRQLNNQLISSERPHFSPHNTAKTNNKGSNLRKNGIYCYK